MTWRSKTVDMASFVRPVLTHSMCRILWVQVPFNWLKSIQLRKKKIEADTGGGVDFAGTHRTWRWFCNKGDQVHSSAVCSLVMESQPPSRYSKEGSPVSQQAWLGQKLYLHTGPGIYSSSRRQVAEDWLLPEGVICLYHHHPSLPLVLPWSI
jgi:hypothetical protein